MMKKYTNQKEEDTIAAMPSRISAENAPEKTENENVGAETNDDDDGEEEQTYERRAGALSLRLTEMMQ